MAREIWASETDRLASETKHLVTKINCPAPETHCPLKRATVRHQSPTIRPWNQLSDFRDWSSSPRGWLSNFKDRLTHPWDWTSGPIDCPSGPRDQPSGQRDQLSSIGDPLSSLSSTRDWPSGPIDQLSSSIETNCPAPETDCIRFCNICTPATCVSFFRIYLLICCNVSSQRIAFTLTFLGAAQLGLIVCNCWWISWPNKVHTNPKHALNSEKLYNLQAKLTYLASTIHLGPYCYFC